MTHLGRVPYDEGVHLPDAARVLDLSVTSERVRAAASARGLQVTRGGRSEALPVDPVPRVVTGAEWDRLAAGLVQRLRALEAFLRAPDEAVRSGAVPGELVTSSVYYDSSVPEAVVPVGVYGPDVVRGPEGDFLVLEDNLRTPTLMAYAAEVACCVRAAVPVPAGRALRPALAGLAEALRRVLHAAAPPDADEPVVAVLTDEPTDHEHVEPTWLARLLGVPVVAVSQLRRRGARLVLPDGRAVDVLWRRTSEERLRDDSGRLNPLGEALLGPLQAGTVQVVNPFGTGVADDKRLHAHVEDLVRCYLGEEPALRSVPSYDLGDPSHLAVVRERLDELVLKPRSGSGGRGIALMPWLADEERRGARRAVLGDPAGWAAQEVVAMSTCPTFVDGQLVPRRVDLRPFVLSTGQDRWVLPGGMSRTAARQDQLVVNFDQGGVAKDTWVLDDVPSAP